MSKRKLTARQTQRVRAIQERRRQGAQDRADRQDRSLPETTLGPEQTGVVVAQYGANLVVEDPSGALRPCLVRQNLGTLVCGDHVVWQSSNEKLGVVTARLPRRSVLNRPGYYGRDRALAANLDQIIIVSAVQPELSESLIDRYLVAAERTAIAPLILINKVDLLDADGQAATAARLEPFRRIGYPILYASTHSAHGLDYLIEQLAGHTSVLVGHSGVGKSSLVGALLPDRDIRIGRLSTASGLGRHTTSTATLYRLPQGGALIDSPGVRNFHLWDLEPTELIHGFREFAAYLGHCQFRDCRHEQDPGCALRAAAQMGEIHPRRLASYRLIRKSLEEALARKARS